jgi:hypothetical protein
MHRFARRPHHLLSLTIVLALALLALASPALAASAGTTVLVSRPDGTALFTPPHDGSVSQSAPLAVSDDGRFVAFVSQARLDPAANPLVWNLYLRDTVANTTTLVSRSDGASGAAANADVGMGSATHSGDTIGIALWSAGGSGDAPHNQTHVLVAFSTMATNLVDHTDRATEPTQGGLQVWMRDVTAGTTYLVSRANGLTGAPADGPSWQPSIAAGPNGAYVAYTSQGTNLYPPAQTGGERAVYLREVGTGVSHRVDNLLFCQFDGCGGAPDGVSDQPSLRFVTGRNGGFMCSLGQLCAVVAFRTSDKALLRDYPTQPDNQIAGAHAVLQPDGTLGDFGDFRVASVADSNPPMLADTGASQPKLTAEGDGVAFLSGATNLDPFSSGPFGTHGYFTWWGGLVDIRPLGTDPVSHENVLPDANITHLSVGGTFDHPRTATDTTASNWAVIPLSEHGGLRAYADTPTTWEQPLDTAPDGTVGDGQSGGTEVSADGKTVVFYSNSMNLAAGNTTGFTRVYKRVLNASGSGWGPLQLVSRPTGTGSFPQGATDSDITDRVASADGRFVAFRSDDVDLVPENAQGAGLRHIFVRDTVNGTTTLVDRANGAGGAPATLSGELVGISDDGRRVMFNSGSPNLCPGCDHGIYAYVRDLSANTTTVVSRENGPTGAPAPVDAEAGSLSGDGTHAAFLSLIPLDPRAANGQEHVYVRDIANATTTFADRDDGARGAAAQDDAFAVSLDRDGGRLAWESKAIFPDLDVLDGTYIKVYVRDLNAGTTVLASRAAGADGALPNADALRAVIDAAGDAVAFDTTATSLGAVSHRSVWLRQLNTSNTLLVSRAGGAAGAPADADAWKPSIDAAGDKVAFMSMAPDLGAGGSLGWEAYVRNVNANTTDLVSRVNGAGGAPADPAGIGVVSISGNGACAAFSGEGLNYTDPLASNLYLAVRERALTASCGAGTAGGVAAALDSSPPAAGLDAPAASPAPPVLAVPVPQAADTALTRLTASPASFYVGAHGGTQLSFALSKPATVTVTFDRLLPGRAHAAACTASARSGRRCTLVRPAGRLTVHAHAGVNRIRFSGRIGRRALAPGAYRWTATPLHGRARAGRFAVVRAPRPRAARRAR